MTENGRKSPSWTLCVYRGLGRIFRSWMRKARGLSVHEEFFAQPSLAPLPGRRAWVHVASAGELEIAWPLIIELCRQKVVVRVTAFSSSARKSLMRLKGILPELEVGFSPYEGGWEGALRSFKPEVFISVKYEAWPDLWASLQILDVPLVLLGARVRESFKIAHGVLGLFGIPAPAMMLLAFSQKSLSGFENAGFFPSESHLVRDPRWQRVRARQSDIQSTAFKRVDEVLEHLAQSTALPRPWGIFGSVWPEDLEQLQKAIEESGIGQGTLWFAPHSMSDEVRLQGFGALKGGLVKHRKNWVFSRPSVEGGSRKYGPTAGLGSWVWVNEVGILTELYTKMDWAFVGGGFRSSGAHSTIEPAAAGIPVAVGPGKLENFDETHQLLQEGSLTVIRTELEGFNWMKKVAESPVVSFSNKSKYSDIGVTEIVTLTWEFVQRQKNRTI